MDAKNIGKTTFQTISFGCRVNFAEEQEIQKKMLEKGFLWDEKKPDIVIINTCAVTDKAEREGKQLIYKIKRNNPKVFLIVTGCGETNWQRQSLLGKLPIDLAVDNISKSYLADLIFQKVRNIARRHSRGSGNLGKDSLVNSEYEEFNYKKLPLKFFSSGRYLIKIQDGCHRFCTYCIVPYLRGTPKSYKTDMIVDSIINLPEGILEVILTAINTEAYGKDTGENFIDLVKKILDKTKVKRISFGSIHPWSIDNNFFSFYKKEISGRSGNSGRLVDFFHIPLQSGSDEILDLMKRGYKSKEIMEKLLEIQKLNPFALIGTDVIAGFLGENDHKFEQTYKFLEKSPISKFHIFRFSSKKGTAAFYMSKKVKEPSSDKKRVRSQALIALGYEKYHKFQEKMIGKEFSCLLINKKRENYQEGLISNQLPILIKSKKLVLHGIRQVKVTEWKNSDLIGELID